ncbi:peptidoglycan editing factor PgeF [Candidatus Chlamydia corallus]|uniref:peptidoglycan editing factor PgeF n=1 Tax=Candidatus Chlamydia corallus TaxID=2038470 RepID=UPI000C2FE404|nr:peptidoglycan editing factor PgeF [Candidatus Chlamydia corallus]
MTLAFHGHPLNYWTFEELNGFPIRHGIFSKQQDEEGTVFAAQNPEIAKALRSQNYCDLHQRHGTSIHAVTPTSPHYQPADGLCTQSPLLSLHIRHSDCQAAIFYDREHHAIANVHSGWRGLLGNIYAVTVGTMKKLFHTKTQDLFVAIGPSIGPDFAIYPDYATLFPRSFLPFMNPKNHFDLRAIAQKQLSNLGIPKDHIFISNLCTYSEHEAFFSSRYRSHHPDPKLDGQNSKSKNNVTAVLLLPRE